MDLAMVPLDLPRPRPVGHFVSAGSDVLPLLDMIDAEPQTQEAAPGKRTRTTKPRSNAEPNAKAKSSRSTVKRTIAKTKSTRTSSRKLKLKVRVNKPSKPKAPTNNSNANDDDDRFAPCDYKATRLEKLFRWPQHMVNAVLREYESDGKSIHIQAWTEFSGAGTAEFALKGICSKTNALSCRIMSSADWGQAASTSLINNSDDHTHVFGDIADLCPSDMMQQVQKRVAVTVPCFTLVTLVCLWATNDNISLRSVSV